MGFSASRLNRILLSLVFTSLCDTLLILLSFDCLLMLVHEGTHELASFVVVCGNPVAYHSWVVSVVMSHRYSRSGMLSR